MHTYRITVHKSKRVLLYTLIHIRNNSLHSNGIHISEARGEGDSQEGERANKAIIDRRFGEDFSFVNYQVRRGIIPRIRTSVGILIDKNST
jgi:hypothetical protein